jgi:hypothetical protein
MHARLWRALCFQFSSLVSSNGTFSLIIEVNRRDLLRSTATIVGGFGSPVPFGATWAQSRQETLLVVSKNGPNNLDVQGVRPRGRDRKTITSNCRPLWPADGLVREANLGPFPLAHEAG